MIDLINEAYVLQSFLESRGFRFYFIGGIALQVWGEPRLTRDIDVTVFTELTDEPSQIRQFLEHYDPKFSDVESFALTHRVLPVRSKNGIDVDILLNGIADLSEMLTRSSYQKLTQEISLNVCSASDLIALKTLAARGKDWTDIESIIIKQPELDWEYIERIVLEVDGYDEIGEKLENLKILRELYYRK